MSDLIAKDLRARLMEFDGRAVSILGEAEARWHTQPGYFDALITLAQSPAEHVSDGATWLIKSALERGAECSDAQINALVGVLSNVTAWSAQLHLCQSLRMIAFEPHHAARVADWLRPLIDHPRPFLRAWALDALGHIATIDARYSAEYQAALAKALEDDAASVRARARKLAG